MSGVQKSRAIDTTPIEHLTSDTNPTQAQSAIAQARKNHVPEKEIFSAFAALGLSEEYADAAKIAGGKVQGQLQRDNADERTFRAFTDLRVAVTAERAQPAAVDHAVATLDALGAVAASGATDWTIINTGNDDRANQLLSRAREAGDLAYKLNTQAFFASDDPAKRSALVSEARKLKAAATRMLSNPFVVANAPKQNQEAAAKFIGTL